MFAFPFPEKPVFNEWYAKDTSNKIKTVFDARMRDGKRCSGSVPYGYNRLPGDKQTLVVDPVASEVVKCIFELADEGKSPGTIANILTQNKTLIPSAYMKEYHPEQYLGMKFSDPFLWTKSTVTKILNRKEYLGCTILHKSVNTNFKLHKRRATSEDEQYVFENTHEPIISQELWDSVQRKKGKANRTNIRGTHHNRLSGYVYCADCGKRMTLQTHRNKKDKSKFDYSFRCGGYVSKVETCTPHSIMANKLEALVLSSVKRMSRFALKDEEAFAIELQALWNEKQEEKPKQSQTEIRRLKKRYDELSTLIRGLYENLMSGMLPERQYKILMKQYDEEQAEIEKKMDVIQETVDTTINKKSNINHFISLIRKYKEPEEVTDYMLSELIDKIVVYEAEGIGNNRTQKVDIYFNYVGQVDLAYTDEEIAEMKAEEDRKKQEQKAHERERQREIRKKRRDKKIEENGGSLRKKKICPYCGTEFIPTGNRQIFCTKECCYKQRQLEQKKEKERSVA